MLIQRFLLSTLLAAATAHSTPSERHATVPATGPVTRPDTHPIFVPPPPYAPDAPFQGRFWYGSEALWAMPSADGLWHGLATSDGKRQKVFWWSSAWDWRTDHQPALAASARVLGSVAPEVRVHSATNAHSPSASSKRPNVSLLNLGSERTRDGSSKPRQRNRMRYFPASADRPRHRGPPARQGIRP